MLIEKRFPVQVGRLVFLLSLISFLALSRLPAAADWVDDVKDELYLQEARVLKGTAFLDDPVSGGTIQVYDRNGFLLHCIDSATGEDGSFSLTLPLPESFTLVITKGEMAGRSFKHELIRYVHLFDPTQKYKVNAITTLLGAYLADHPDIPYREAKDAVRAFLSIPETIDLDEIIYSSEWYCYYFSHYAFMKEADAMQGMEPFIKQLLKELEAGRTRCFYDPDSIGSSFFKDFMAALMKGAASKFGGEGTGWILGLLNMGGDDVDSRLQDMEKDLQGILSTLENILTTLKNLAHDLAMDTNEVEIYIEGQSAQDAVTLIKTHYAPEDPNSRGDTNTLKWYANCTSADSNPTVRAQIETFVENVNGAWDVESQVQKIHDAIIPDIGNTDGLLDLWTKNFLLQGPIGSDQLMSYYQTLEQYFAVLLFYQFKGANIVVEALNYQSGAGSPVNGFAQGDVTPAYSYLTGTFQPMIQEETDRFLQCVLKLLFSNSGLYWERRFLPDSAQGILARATFFIVQTLGQDHYALRTGAIGTRPLVNDVFCMGSGEYGVVADASADVELSERPYDSWGKDLKTLTYGDVYTYKYFDLYPYWKDPGTYEVWWSTDSGSPYYLGIAEVKKYTEGYVQDDTKGTISYGYFMAPFRVGGKEAMMAPSIFVRNQYTVNQSGNVISGYSDGMDPVGNLFLTLSAHNRYNDEGSNISQKLEWYHPFTFTGSQATTAYLNSAGSATGSAYWFGDNHSGNECSIKVTIGLWDVTHNKDVQSCSHGVSASNGDTKNLNVALNDQISFTLQPGVSYYVYANVTGSGTANYCEGVTYRTGYSYTNTLYLVHLSLTFVNTEYWNPSAIPFLANHKKLPLPLFPRGLWKRLKHAAE